MFTIRATNVLNAPIEQCFETSLDIDLELRACRDFGLRVIAGRSHGQIAKGETVTWQTRQYGLRITHTTLLSEYKYPSYFQDRMLRGFFGVFVHDHFFCTLSGSETKMRDEMRFSSPCWIPPFPFERWVLAPRLNLLLVRRNEAIRAAVENRR